MATQSSYEDSEKLFKLAKRYAELKEFDAERKPRIITDLDGAVELQLLNEDEVDGVHKTHLRWKSRYEAQVALEKEIARLEGFKSAALFLAYDIEKIKDEALRNHVRELRDIIVRWTITRDDLRGGVSADTYHAAMRAFDGFAGTAREHAHKYMREQAKKKADKRQREEEDAARKKADAR